MVDMMHSWFLAVSCTQSHRGILSCGLLVLRDCIYMCNFGCYHAIFPTHWFLSMYVGIAAWNRLCDSLYFGHFASFMIMFFDCTGNHIRCITLTGMADVYIYILLIFVHISGVLQIAWSDETCFHDGLMSFWHWFLSTQLTLTGIDMQCK